VRHSWAKMLRLISRLICLTCHLSVTVSIEKVRQPSHEFFILLTFPDAALNFSEGRETGFKIDRWLVRPGYGLHDYVRLATRLGSNFEQLKSMRLNMRDNLLGSDACDTIAFARSMEKLYREIWEF
jgi:hypothetical protein